MHGYTWNQSIQQLAKEILQNKETKLSPPFIIFEHFKVTVIN